MLKNKRILLTILAILLLILIPNMVKATNESPTKSSEISSANKSVKVTLTEISLDESKEYKFGVSKAKASVPTEWLDLQDVSSEECVAIITPQNEAMRIILRGNDKCYLFIKNVTDDEITITTQVDLSLPVESALNITLTDTNNFNISYLYRNGNDVDNYYITAVKIDDINIIKKYLEAKNNNEDVLSAIKNMLPTEIPSNNSWRKMTAPSTFNYAYHYNSEITKYEGLYMICGQVSYKEGRSIYGYTLYDNYPNGYKLPEEDKTNTDNSDTDTKKPDSTPGTTNKVDNNKTDKTNKDDTTKTTNTKKDTTTAPGSMPYTGGTAIIMAVMGVIVAVGIYAYKRNNDLKGI